MRRGLVLLVGLTTFGAGIWLIATEHTRANACKGTTISITTGASSTACQNVGWAYFAGFVVIGAGLLIFIAVLLMGRHEPRHRRHPERPTESSFRIGVARTAAESDHQAIVATAPPRRRGSAAQPLE